MSKIKNLSRENFVLRLFIITKLYWLEYKNNSLYSDKNSDLFMSKEEYDSMAKEEVSFSIKANEMIIEDILKGTDKSLYEIELETSPWTYENYLYFDISTKKNREKVYEIIKNLRAKYGAIEFDKIIDETVIDCKNVVGFFGTWKGTFTDYGRTLNACSDIYKISLEVYSKSGWESDSFKDLLVNAYKLSA